MALQLTLSILPRKACQRLTILIQCLLRKHETEKINLREKKNIEPSNRQTSHRESTKHGSPVHGPPPWTPSVDRVQQDMDRVHGPPIFTSAETSSNQRSHRKWGPQIDFIQMYTVFAVFN